MPRWHALPAGSDVIDCAPPYSFFSNVVERYFLADTNQSPLLRICAIARQQGVTRLVVECAIARPDVAQEVTALDRRCGGGGEAQAIAFSFIKLQSGGSAARDLSQGELLAHLVLINYKARKHARFTHSYVYEAVLPPPKRPYGNRSFDFPQTLVLPTKHFECNVLGHSFSVRGILYCQQNDTLHVCAHSCLRMAIGSSRHSPSRISSDRINRILGIKEKVDFLGSGQIAQVIDASGMKAAVRTDLKPDQYLAELASLIDSGYLAMLGFTTKGGIGHVVTAFGHSRRADQWHPQAMHAYSGPRSARYLPSSSWIDHFFIHDDNLGPYLSLSARSFVRNPQMQLSCVIGLLPRPAIGSNQAETIAASLLRSLPPLPAIEGQDFWMGYISKRSEALTLRSVLISKTEYLEHLKRAKAHDRSRADRTTLAALDRLDESFWMVEFSFPTLYTGNRSKLGEVLIGATDHAGGVGSVLALRLPGRVLSVSDGDVYLWKSSLTSHSAIYEHRGTATKAA